MPRNSSLAATSLMGMILTPFSLPPGICRNMLENCLAPRLAHRLAQCLGILCAQLRIADGRIWPAWAPFYVPAAEQRGVFH
jgi:hypothetical protein